MRNAVVEAESWGPLSREHPAVTSRGEGLPKELDAVAPRNTSNGAGGGLGVVFLGAVLGMVGAIMMFASGAGLLKAILIYSIGGTLASLCIASAAFVLSVGDSDH